MLKGIRSCLRFFILSSFFLFSMCSNSKNKVHLSSVSKDLLDNYLLDSNKSYSLDSLKECIRLDFIVGNDQEEIVRIYNYDLEETCKIYTYLANYKGFCVFYQGEINSLFISEIDELDDASLIQNCCELKDTTNISIKKNKDNVLEIGTDPNVYLEFDPALVYLIYLNDNDVIRCEPDYLNDEISRNMR